MKVWIAFRGERHEGGYILGVFASKVLADQACANEMNKEFFSHQVDYVTTTEWPVE